jgi:hypothetical protein
VRIEARSEGVYHDPWPYAPLAASSGIEGISSGLKTQKCPRSGIGPGLRISDVHMKSIELLPR